MSRILWSWNFRLENEAAVCFARQYISEHKPIWAVQAVGEIFCVKNCDLIGALALPISAGNLFYCYW